MKIYIGYDHRSVKMAYSLMESLVNAGYEVNEPFENNSECDDYPDIALAVATKLQKDKKAVGLLLCGTGIGMNIVANKFDGVRSVLAHSEADAYFARRHENVNVLVLAAGYDDGNYKVTSAKNPEKIVETFLNTSFEGDRHIRRLNKIMAIEGNN